MMNHLSRNSVFFVFPLIITLVMMWGLTSCTSMEDMEQDEYGYVQFRLYKSASYDKENPTRAGEGQLDSLAVVRKMKIEMEYEGSTLIQILRFNSFNSENGEYGLRSDKLKLLPGQYKVKGYTLYNKVDEEIVSPIYSNMFTVDGGGMTVIDLTVDAVPRGTVSFRLVKDIVPATKAYTGNYYPFGSIRVVDITVRNATGDEVEFKKIRVNYKEDFIDQGTPGKNPECSYADCDTTVWLNAGTYRVSAYKTYSDRNGKLMLEAAVIPSTTDKYNFVIEDNQYTENAPVPVRLHESDESIKDYMALKEIWEKMDGPNWKYYGEDEVPGSNWNFNKEIDLWGQQPGVQLDEKGRVATLSLSGFGAKGVVPEAIGQLTELRILSLGTHSEKTGGSIHKNFSARMSEKQLDAARHDYAEHVLYRDVREGRYGMSEILQEGINANYDKRQTPIRKSRRTYSTDPEDFGKAPDFTNSITGISKAMMRLTNLQQFYIANSPITSENFFVPLASDSRYKSEEDSWSWSRFTGLFDIEIYNCANLTSLPMEFLNGIPEIQSLNIACSLGISGAQLKADWENFLMNGAGVDKLQILYMGFNRLEEFPEHDLLKKMKKLGLLDCTTNKIHTLHPFGKDIQLVNVMLDWNEITEIPSIDGFFCGYNDMEGFNCSHNKLKELPDIFNAKSVYVMKGVDFSFNQISGLENGDAHRGINASQVNLRDNHLKKFPSRLFKAGSPINYIILAGNGMTEIEKGALQGENTFNLQSIDLSYNRLEKLPDDDFLPTTLPFLYGIDLSFNAFKEFPYAPLLCQGLSIMNIRGQRDADGNRTLKEWPTGIGSQCPSLIRFYIGYNDLGKIEDEISPYIRILDIKDNPRISIDVSTVCPYIQAGVYALVYDKTQDIRGCDGVLDLVK